MSVRPLDPSATRRADALRTLDLMRAAVEAGEFDTIIGLAVCRNDAGGALVFRSFWSELPSPSAKYETVGYLAGLQRSLLGT